VGVIAPKKVCKLLQAIHEQIVRELELADDEMEKK
jgi:hypothetical protein